MPRSRAKRKRKRDVKAISRRLVELINREFADEDVDCIVLVIHHGYYSVNTSLTSADEARALLADAARGGLWRPIRTADDTNQDEGT